MNTVVLTTWKSFQLKSGGVIEKLHEKSFIIFIYLNWTLDYIRANDITKKEQL